MPVRVQEADFDPGAELEALAANDPEIGAVVSFTGLVRGSGGVPPPAAIAPRRSRRRNS